MGGDSTDSYKLGNIMTVVRSRTQGLRVEKERSASHRKLWAFDLDTSYMLRIRKDQCASNGLRSLLWVASHARTRCPRNFLKFYHHVKKGLTIP
ncbi:LOW QUALITY PROTEIN: hypothetical protein NC653_026897 [Populus alba x Populus x berolinensis]|uniref:Uncharacterized protein n=1 Tax=Populus alba x Populus x berolinensis TaxID=444605 RepID=A0AAD6M6P9_9ROSI|nr:LOW QUALITY PROTEIN: hypothetical protein NC653_026897 [Populus alba x Populus x berolinensis]